MVASEIATGNKKNSVSNAMSAVVTAVVFGLSLPALADPLIVTGTHLYAEDYAFGISPSDLDLAHVDGYQYENQTAGAVLTITGALPSISVGKSGIVESSTIRDLLASGKITLKATDNNNNTTNITTPQELANYQSTNRLITPSQNAEFQVTDPADPENSAIIRVYKSTDLASYLAITPLGSVILNTYDAAQSAIYNGFGIGLAKGGATVNLDIGDKTKNARDNANTVALLAKDSSLLTAQNPGSTVHWRSDNYIDFQPAPVVPQKTFIGVQSTDRYGGDVTVDVYGYNSDGNAVKTGEKTFSISSQADLAAFNDWLLGNNHDAVTNAAGNRVSQVQLWLDSSAVTSTTAAQDKYAALINSVINSSSPSGNVSWTYDVWTDGESHDNNTTLGRGDLHAIYANGAGTFGYLDQAALLAVDGSTNGVMSADGGGTIENSGQLNALRTTTGRDVAIGMKVDSATATNTATGIINSGLFIDKDGRQNVNNYGAYGMYGTGTSGVINHGVINQAITTDNYGTAAAANPWSSETPSGNTLTLAVGMRVADASQGTNNGTINVVDGRSGGNRYGAGTAYGVQVSDAATFANGTGGIIYLGREANSIDDAQDVTLTGGSSLSAGIYAQGSGLIANNGTITLGGKVRNAAGILIGSATGSVNNAGTITINGGTAAGRALNYGISVRNSGAADGQIIDNNGTINVNGADNVGIHVVAGTQNAKALTGKDGRIVVNGTGGKNDRNYAIWAEGTQAISGVNAYTATVDIDSAMTLQGAGDIGVHVRNNAVANVNSAGSPSFGNTDQIGYYLYGNGSMANIENAVIDDSSQDRTTIFRIANGATFNGQTHNPQTGIASDLALTLSGANSVGILGTLTGSNVNTGQTTINVSGNGAAALVIEGGATGNIAKETTINLAGVDTTAGIVDGQAHQLNGNNTGGQTATTLTTNATITSETLGNKVIAYLARNLGEIVLGNDAVINLASKDSIGIDIQQGGRLTNSSVNAIQVADGIGVRASGNNAVINKLGTLQVDDGTAGVQLTSGARLTITGDSANGLADNITTRGSADGIQLAVGAGSLTASDVTIGALGSGAGIQNNAERADITLRGVTINATDGSAIRTSVALNVKDGSDNQLNVTGAGAGFAFETATGGEALGDLNIGTGYRILVHNDAENATGTGIRANTSGNVTSSADITIADAGGGSAILATHANSLTNTGAIATSSAGASALLVTDVSSILNTGSIVANRPGAAVIDASGNGNKTITNGGTLMAASDNATAIESGLGDDTIDISGERTIGVINTGGGKDRFIWNRGVFAGEVNFTGNDGSDTANIGDVSLAAVRHIISEGGAGGGSTLTLTHTNGADARVGTLASDNIAIGTNIGTGWDNLVVTGNRADVRIVDSLRLSGASPIAINDGATLRSGDRGDATSSAATLGNYGVVTQGANSRLVFDTLGDDYLAQIYQGMISGDGQFERAGGGTTVFVADNTYLGQTTIDAGGTLQLGYGGNSGGISSASAIIDNGVLAVNRANDVALAGIISGSGELHQIGQGTTRLSGNNAYAGTTQVTEGTLLINGDQTAATGTTSVAGAAALGGTGIVGGDVEIANAATLSPGDRASGTLTINGNLTLSPRALSQFELGQAYVPGGRINDLVNVAGNLILDGALNVAQSAGGSFGPGVYRIYNYSGSLDNQTLDVGVVPAGQDRSGIVVQTALNHQVNLVNANGITLQFWDGAASGASHGASGIEGDGVIEGGDGKWMAIGDGGDNNWTHQDGVGNAPWAQNAFAVFQGQGGMVSVDHSAGQVNFAGAQFAADGYVVTGDALNAVATTTGSDYAGQTPATGELLIRVGAGAAGDDYTATIASIIQESTAGDKLTLVKTDVGRLILDGENRYQGGTRIDGGTLQISADGNLGASGTDLVINNGSTLQLGHTLATDRTITLGADNTAVFDLNSNGFRPSGEITGAGSLAVTSSSSFAGSTLALNQINRYQGNTQVIGTGQDHNVTVDVTATGALGGTSTSSVTLTKGATMNIRGDDTNLEAHVFSLYDSMLTLADRATAAMATLNAFGDAQVIFADRSGAAGATISLNDGSRADFGDNTTAGEATVSIAAGSILNLRDDASGGGAEVTNHGLVAFADRAMAENAVVANWIGGRVDISAVDRATAIGSLSGAGNVALGANALSLGNLARTDRIGGMISGDGGSLIKTGGGILELTGDNTYTGTTDVAQGTLLVNGDQSAATGQVMVAAGATLGGAGVLGGAVAVGDEGHLAAGAAIGMVGTLTTGALSLGKTSQLDYQFGQAYAAGGVYNDLINVKGDLTLDGQLNIQQTEGRSFDVGVYRVINFTGALTDNILEIATAPAAADSLYVQTSVKHQVNLVNRAGLTLRFWDGAGGADGELKNNGAIDGGGGIWQASAGNDNWTTDETDPEGALNAPFTNASFAVFQGAAGTVTVDNSLGDVVIGGAQFATDGYRVTGDSLTITNPDTTIRVGDGSADGANDIATIASVITGGGGLDKRDLGTLVLEGDNRYTGGTTISAGTLQVMRDNNLGAAGAGVAFDGGTLKYGSAFDTARRLTLQAGGGTIDTNGNDVALLTAVQGTGGLTKIGAGALTLTQDSTYAGGTTIAQGTLQLGAGGATGGAIGDVVDNGTLIINRANTYGLTGNVSGSGQLIQAGKGTTVLSANNTYAGATLVDNGVLRAGSASTFSAASLHQVAEGAILDTRGFNQTVGGLDNAGLVTLSGDRPGSTLTVKGDYSGTGGVINLAAAHNSQGQGTADRLIVDGGSAGGHTTLNIDGSRLGAATRGDGIEVVSALNGATTTAQSTRDAFTLAGDRLDAGAFEYRLRAGTATGQGENWYLNSSYRPEVSLLSGLAGVVRQADIAILGNMHQRMGDDSQTSANHGGEQRAWARIIGRSDKTRLDDATGTETDSNAYGVQIGADLYNGANWQTGLYASVLNIDSNVTGSYSGGRGHSGKIDDNAFYLGGYATYLSGSGFYLDNVLQYGNHNVSASASGTHGDYRPDGNSVIASGEIGQAFRLGRSAWSIEPQAQLIYQYSTFDDSTLAGATRTRAGIDPADSFTARIGVRLVGDYLTHHGRVQPYARVNLWQGLGAKDKTHFTNDVTTTTLASSQQYSSTELATGATWSVSKDVQAYGEVGTQFSNGSGNSQVKSPVNASVGLKMMF